MDQGNSQNAPEEDPQSTEVPSSLKPNQPSETKVKVALRVRPFIHKEIIDNEQKCTQCFSQTKQVLIGKDKSFTFDYVFDDDSKQEEVYEYCAKELVPSCLAGYNTTILAYGQTGSGKTYTMGSNSTYETNPKETGIIPRVMRELFTEIEKRKTKSEFILRVSFLEIYNEEIQDLLDTTAARFRFNPAYYNKNPIAIREEKDGSISVYGAKEEKVTSFEEMTAYLEKGSLQRSTASTLMNETSSRSHAIFTISIEQHQIDDLYKKNPKGKSSENANFTIAKFHFVDLAGSERLKKTGASGSILREGININRGLLALGNVISALTDLSGKINHVPYRESKLTRILQDSLGGNSRTVMIACISPAESNFDESLNTLKYASRARNIKNKPIVNTDPQSTVISHLKQQVFELQNQLLNYKRLFSSNMKENFQGDPQALASLLSGSTSFTGPFRNDETEALKEEVKLIKIKLVQYEKELAVVSNELQQTKMSLNESEISSFTMQRERDILKNLNEKYKKALDENNITVPLEDSELELEKQSLIEEYSKAADKLKHDLKDKEKVVHETNKEYENLLKSSARDQELLLEKTKIIQALTSQLRKQEAQSINIDHLRIENKDDTPDSRGEREDNSGEEDKLEREFESSSQLHRKEMLLVEGSILEKEELLKSMTQNQYLLEKNLVEEMKNQYHKKAIQMEQEVKILEKQRDEALSKASTAMQENDKNKIILTYKQKLSELEVKIKDFKKKEKEQQSLIKLVDTQRSKIQQLDDEIRKVKTQKMQLHKKVKEEAEKFEKWRGSRQKELLDAKKSNIEKDLVISKLKTENKKKDLIYKKKAEELLSKSISKELLAQIQSESFKAGTPSRRKKNQYSDENGGFSFDESQATLLGEEEAKQLVEYCSERLIENLKLSFRIEKEEEGLRKTEEELELEKNKYAELMLKRDKTEIERRGSIDDLDEEQTLEIKLQEYDLELNEKSTRIESLEAKMDFQLAKVNELTDELGRRPKLSPEQLLLHNERIWKNSANMKLVLRCLLGKYIGASLDGVKFQERVNKHVIDMNEMRRKLEDAEQKAKLNELQYEISLAKLTREYERNQQLLLIKEQNFHEDEDSNLNNNNEIVEDVNQNPKTLESMYQTGQTNDTIPSPDEILSPNTISNNKNNWPASAEKEAKSKTEIESPIKKSNPALTNSTGKTKGNAENLLEQNKRLEKLVSELTRKQSTSEKIIENLKKKCEVLQMKYDQIKKTPIKEKTNIKVSNEERGTPLANVNNQTDRSQYSTNTSTLSMNNSSLNASIFNSGRKFDEGEVTDRQKSAAALQQKGLLNLASIREKRKEEKFKQGGETTTNRTVIEESKVDRQKGIMLESIGKSQSVSANMFGQPGLKNKKPTISSSKRQESPKKQSNTSIHNTTQKNESQSESLETESKGSEFIPKDNGNESVPSDEALEEIANLKCHANIEGAHSSPIYYATSLGNMLYSSGYKTFKVWSLDAITSISEVLAHSSYIKTMAIWPEKNLLATAGDKIISLWDLVSLQNVATLKGHKDDIKTLAVFDNLLFSGGKGSATNNALLVWDLRNLNPIEEKEKDQEIVSMVTHNQTLYYGNQSHQIRGVGLTNMQALAPFEPSHQDNITSLAIVKDQLVSASKDSTLRLWDLNHYILNLKHTWTFPKDYVNAIESNITQDVLYSGSKGGIIKIWNVSEGKLNCFGTMRGHTQSINSICKLYDEYESMFATASSDRSIKIWKPKEEESSEELMIKLPDSN